MGWLCLVSISLSPVVQYTLRSARSTLSRTSHATLRRTDLHLDASPFTSCTNCPFSRTTYSCPRISTLTSTLSLRHASSSTFCTEPSYALQLPPRETSQRPAAGAGSAIAATAAAAGALPLPLSAGERAAGAVGVPARPPLPPPPRHRQSSSSFSSSAFTHLHPPPPLRNL